MNTTAKRAAILLAPLVVGIAFFSLLLWDSTNDRRDYAIGQAFGLIYGIYAAVGVMSWVKSSRNR
jgi:hypothetical protein